MDWDTKASSYNATVAFDEARTSLKSIVDTLARSGYPIQGEPTLLD